jgi:hypothetical protein
MRRIVNGLTIYSWKVIILESLLNNDDIMTREERIAQAAEKEAYVSMGDFIRGAKWADKHPNWTRIDDKKPPLGCRVLLQTKEHAFPIIGELQEDGGIYQFCNQYYDKLDVTVTHWIDVPLGPESIEEFDKFMEHLKEEN